MADTTEDFSGASKQAWIDVKEAQDKYKQLHDDFKKVKKPGKGEDREAYDALKTEVEAAETEIKTAKKLARETSKDAGKVSGEAAAEKHLGKEKLTKAKDKANTIGSINGKTFEGELPKEKMGFLDRLRSNFTGERNVSSRELENKIGKLDRLEKSRERLVKANLSTEKVDKQIGELKPKIETEAKKLFPALSEAKVAREELISKFEKQRNKALEDSEKGFRKEIKGDKKSEKRLLAELEAEQKKINKKFDKAIKEQNKTIEKFTAIEEQVEKHTGLKAVDHLDTKALTKAAGAGDVAAKTTLAAEKGIITKSEFMAKSAPGKMMAAAEYNWKSGGFGKARVAVGSLLGGGLAISGLDDITQGVGIRSAGTDAEGHELSTEGKLFSGAAKLGGAALAIWAALAGGKAGAMGMSKA